MPRATVRRRPRALLLPGFTLLCVGLALACSAGPESLDQRVAEAVSEAYPSRRVDIVGPGELLVTDAEGDELSMYMDNLRLACDEDPEACEGHIAQRVAALADHDNAAPAGADQLRPVLKDADYLFQADQMAAGADTAKAAAASRLLRKPFQGDLYVIWVLDRPDSMQMVSQGTLEDLGMTQEALEAKALENLAACCSELPVQPVEDGPGLFQVWVGDSYEAARLLLHEPWGALADTVPGDLVVAAPSREVVLFTGSEDSTGLFLLNELATEMTESAHGLSSQLLHWTPEGWETVNIEPMQ